MGLLYNVQHLTKPWIGKVAMHSNEYMQLGLCLCSWYILCVCLYIYIITKINIWHKFKVKTICLLKIHVRKKYMCKIKQITFKCFLTNYKNHQKIIIILGFRVASHWWCEKHHWFSIQHVYFFSNVEVPRFEDLHLTLVIIFHSKGFTPMCIMNIINFQFNDFSFLACGG